MVEVIESCRQCRSPRLARVYFTFYNEARLHQSLGYRTPAEVYRAGRSKEPARSS